MVCVMRVAVVVVLVMVMEMCGGAQLLELSYTYNVDAPTSPKLKPFTFSILQNGTNDLGIWVELNEFCTSEHSGTHVDAPVHFSRNRWHINEIPLERLWRVPGIVIDVSEAIEASGELNYGIQPEDLEAWETVHGIIPDGTIVLIRTGWGRKSHNLREYSGLDENKSNNFPGLSESAAKWITTHGRRHRYRIGIVGVGVDTISMDVGNSTHYLAHQTLYSNNIYGMENIANMDKLPTYGFLVTVMPMRIGGGSGAPARIIAEIQDRDPSFSALTDTSTATTATTASTATTATIVLATMLRLL